MDQTAVSLDSATQVPAHALSESLLNPNAGTRAAEETKTDNLKHNLKLLCQQLGMDFGPFIFTATGGR